jgi:xanthine/CO dehydrogenase XdhC/CoxF family maturation factor
MARGELPPEVGRRRLVAVFVTPVTEFLLHFAKDLGYETIMMDPDSGRLHWAEWRYSDQVATVPTEEFVDRDTDVVLTDEARDELAPTLESFLRLPARWIGVVGGAHHHPPHVDGLRRLGVPDQVIARVRRPAGLNIGSKIPAEIALSTLAGLIADRNRRPGGFTF